MKEITTSYMYLMLLQVILLYILALHIKDKMRLRAQLRRGAIPFIMYIRIKS